MSQGKLPLKFKSLELERESKEEKTDFDFGLCALSNFILLILKREKASWQV